MYAFFLRLAHRLHPAFNEHDRLSQLRVLTDMIRLAYAAFLSIIAFGWLIAVTDLNVVTEHWRAGLLAAASIMVAVQFNMFFDVKIGTEISANFVGNLSGVIAWSFLWLFGLDFIWLLVAVNLISNYQQYRKLAPLSLNNFWQQLRIFSEGIGPSTLAILLMFTVYEALEGNVPVAAFSLETLVRLIAVLFVSYALSIVAAGGLVLAFRMIPIAEELGLSFRQIAIQTAFTVAILDALHLFGAFGSMIQVNLGWGAFIFYLGSIILLGYLTQELSKAVYDTKQRTQEMQNVTALGRALIDAAPDGSMLGTILKEHVSPMITNSHIEIVLLPDRVLLHNMAEVNWTIPDSARQWLDNNAEEKVFHSRDIVPWSNRQIEDPIIVMPIRDRETQQHLGYIWVESWARRSKRTVVNYLNAVRAIADQISAALHAEIVYEQMLAAEKTQQELAFAGQIQASFLPESIPQRDAWQIAAMIEPARQTSGDFFDFIELPDEKLGIVVADVADKGTGAALFMALARTLIRTYAKQHPDHPAAVFAAVNERMLEDSRSGQFVTVFYGVLDPVAGTMTYANAGHNPGYLFNSDLMELKRTGIPLGMLEGMMWQDKTLDLVNGCPLVLYTDGVTEAQNVDEQLYDAPRLMEVIEANSDDHAEVLKDKIVEDVHRFIDDAPQADDITVVIIRRAER